MEYENLDDLRARLGSAMYRLSEESWLPGAPRLHSLEKEFNKFSQEADARLQGMPPRDAAEWLMGNIGSLERLHARTERERWHALRILVWMREGLTLTADFLAEASATATTGAPTVPSWDEAESLVAKAHAEADADDADDADDDDDEGPAIASKEVVAAYRASAMKERDLLLARLRGACARLGGEAACTARGHPWGRGLNAQLGQFVGRAEFCLRGICPIDAFTWLEANVPELEGLHARNRQEYIQAELVLAGLEDRFFGLLYDLARER